MPPASMTKASITDSISTRATFLSSKHCGLWGCHTWFSLFSIPLSLIKLNLQYFNPNHLSKLIQMLNCCPLIFNFIDSKKRLNCNSNNYLSFSNVFIQRKSLIWALIINSYDTNKLLQSQSIVDINLSTLLFKTVTFKFVFIIGPPVIQLFYQLK